MILGGKDFKDDGRTMSNAPIKLAVPTHWTIHPLSVYIINAP
jgi:hypothetical protein